jgi:hypothetical protein
MYKFKLPCNFANKVHLIYMLLHLANTNINVCKSREARLNLIQITFHFVTGGEEKFLLSWAAL